MIPQRRFLSFFYNLLPKKAAKGTKELAIKGTYLVTIGFGLAQIIRLGSNIALAHLLFPEAFGLMALVHVFLHGLGMFSDIGIGPSIIQNNRGDDPVFLNTAWTIQIVRGFFLFGVCCLIAQPISWFYQSPILAIILPIAGLNTIFGGFASTSLFTYNRKLEVGKLTIVELVSQLAGSAIMIIWALFKPTIWALIAGGLSSSLIRLLLSFLIFSSHKHLLKWDKDSVKQIVSFGKWIFLSTAVTFFAIQSDKLFLGKVTSITLLGIYSIAFNLAALPSRLLDAIGNRILFPVFSQSIRENGSNVKEFYKSNQIIILFAGIITILLVVCGESLIYLLYDSRYWEAGWMLKLLAIGAFFRSLQSPIRGFLLASGHSRDIAVGNIAKLMSLLVFFPLIKFFDELSVIIVIFVMSDIIKFLFFIHSAKSKNIYLIKMSILQIINVAASSYIGLQLFKFVNINFQVIHEIFVAAVSSIIAITIFSIVSFIINNSALNKKY